MEGRKKHSVGITQGTGRVARRMRRQEERHINRLCEDIRGKTGEKRGKIERIGGEERKERGSRKERKMKK